VGGEGEQEKVMGDGYSNYIIDMYANVLMKPIKMLFEKVKLIALFYP
jgi:hypothetical protein